MSYRKCSSVLSFLMLFVLAVSASGTQLSGEMKKWHKITLTFDGPQTSETAEPNPFLFYRLNVTFRHDVTGKTLLIPGYYAADGNASETSAGSGNKWRVHFAPCEVGTWTYSVSFRKGEDIAVSEDIGAGTSAGFFDGETGLFSVANSDKAAPDFRSKGRLEYVNKRYLQFADTKEYFIKAGPDAPETLLAYEDFDGTYTRKTPLKKFEPHLRDWRPGDPTWKGGRGKGLIGALNYLSDKGVNAFSFLTYNAGGDGDNVWPFVRRNSKLRYDCSKLDQWQIVFDHAQAKGLYLHFKTQETENDSNRMANGQWLIVPTSLDGGELGVERKLYYRELIARFGYLMALNWNLGEENNQTAEQHKAMADYFARHDPYERNIVIHTYPHQQSKVYLPLLGTASELTGVSLQNHWSEVHVRTLHWVTLSQQAGRPWVVANDEQNSPDHGVPPDHGYQGFDVGSVGYSADTIRHHTLWGNLMAGGAGVEYYFGYALPENDLLCEDWRSRDESWTYAAIALEFFRKQNIPFWRMHCDDSLTPEDNDFCFFNEGEIYLIYQKSGGPVMLDFTAGKFDAGWFNPRTGEGMNRLLHSQVIDGSGRTTLTAPDNKDWMLVIRSRNGGKIAPRVASLTLSAPADFRIVVADDLVPAYVDGGRGALAIDAAGYKDKFAGAEFTFAGPADKYHVTIQTMTETDGECTYILLVNGKEIGSFQNPPTVDDYSPARHKWENVELDEGDVIQVRFNTASNGKIPEGDGFAYARGRWTTLTLESTSGKDIVRPARADGQPAGPEIRIIDSMYTGQVFEERDGLVVVEAEHFARQDRAEKRRWYITTRDTVPGIHPDGDDNHADTASGEAYIELLPDTRRVEGNPLIHGENFSEEGGLMAVLSYPVYFSNPGRYYVWVRAFSTGSEDNGLHVGIDGNWPPTGLRLQWCNGKDSWWWESAQRTAEQHCGEPYKIYLDVDKPGLHTIQFSLREDGFEFDKFLLTTNREFPRPEGVGPAEMVRD